MLDRDGRRFTFLYRCADKGLLASAGLSLRVAGRKIPGCGRNDLIVENAPLTDFQPMAKRPARSLDQPFAPGLVRHGRVEGRRDRRDGPRKSIVR